MRARRYDGAVYMCGYALEVRLKARICRTLHWSGFPNTRSEFQNCVSLKTHDLQTLPSFSGIEPRIKSRFTAEWLIVSQWDPEMRYNPTGSSTAAEARVMLQAVQTLAKVI